MSRKRANKQHPKQSQAVPEEILAEGSGPHGQVAVAAVAVEAAVADVLPVMDEDGTLAVSVTELAIEAEAPAKGKRRGKRGKEVEAAVEAVELVAEEVAEAEPVAIADEVVGDEPVDGDSVELAAEAVDCDIVEGEIAEDVGDEVGATLPTGAASMDGKQLKHLVEALVFASDKPVTLLRLRQLTRVADVARLEAALAELAADFADRGLILQQVSGGYQFRTQTRYSGWVQQLIAGRPVRLSRAQLETLAIIAYRQPITRPEIDEIRGVDSSGTLKVLLDRTLVRILGKKEEVGRPMLYGTTKEFLDFFSLGDLRELPTLREYSELTPESKRVMTDKLGAPADEAPAVEAFAEGSAGIDVVEVLAADEVVAELGAVDAADDVTARESDDELAPVAAVSDAVDAAPTHVEATVADEVAAAEAASADEPAHVEAASDDEPAHLEAASDDEPAHVEAASDDEPAHVEAASDDEPAHVEAASDDEPARVEAASDDEPAHVEAASDDEPAHVEAASDDEPARVEAASDDEPAHVEAASADEPAHVEAASADEPAHIEAASADEPAHVEAASADEPAHVEAASDDEPAHVEAASDDEPAHVEAASDDEPAASEHEIVHIHAASDAEREEFQLASEAEAAHAHAHAGAEAASTDAELLAETETDDELADPALLAEATAVARALAADHDDVDTEIAARDRAEDLEAAPPLDPSDDLLAEPDPHDEIAD